MKKIMECVVNFSEGRRKEIIDGIADTISSTPEVMLLNVDSGAGANRTVYTFIGSPEGVSQAIFEAIKYSSLHIDMSKHHGSHPRIGAADVVPFIPISNMTLEEAAQWADIVARRIAEELNIACYCYEASAKKPERESLANCRSGEYEGIEAKLKEPEWHVDYGPNSYCDSHRKHGITVIGARNFLVAVNFNLDTKDCNLAKKIASRVRWSGYVDNGVRVNGKLKGVRAIGWYIEEYGHTQVSVNIIDISLATLDKVWKETSLTAQEYGVKVTGTEIIGLIPSRVLTDAANGLGITGTTKEQMQEVVERLNISEIALFDIEKRVIEYIGKVTVD